MLMASPGSCAVFLTYCKQEVMDMNMEKLIELDKNILSTRLHRSSSGKMGQK